MNIKDTIEEREEFAQKMQWLIIARFIIYGLAFIIAVMRTFVGVPLNPIFLCSSLFILVLNPIYLFLTKKRLYLYPLAYGSFVIDLLFITTAVHFQGGLAATIFPLNFLLLILGTSILFSLRVGLVMTTLSSIAVIALITLECLNILPPVPIKGVGLALYQDKGYVMTVVIVRVIFFYAVAIVSGHFSDKIKRQAKEIREKGEQLIYVERMAIAARIAGESAHEIKNPLTVIKAGLYYLERILPEDNKVQKTLSQMDKAVQRVVAYINNLLNFSKPPELLRSKININEMIKKAMDELPAEILSNIDVQQELSNDLPDVSVDFDKLKQVVINLVKNGAEAIEQGLEVRGQGSGRIGIRSEKEGEFVKISVSDTGKGMSKENLLRIFDPFFTTKDKGTGLGLFICQRIVEAHNGEIEVKSEAGKGTMFVVKLPRML